MRISKREAKILRLTSAITNRLFSISLIVVLIQLLITSCRFWIGRGPIWPIQPGMDRKLCDSKEQPLLHLMYFYCSEKAPAVIIQMKNCRERKNVLKI